jgi:hypothetical protein
MNFEENKSALDLEYGKFDMPFDLDKLMNLQFDTLKHAIEWLVGQQRKINTKMVDLETMSRPGTPRGGDDLTTNATAGDIASIEIIKFESSDGGGVDPA